MLACICMGFGEIAIIGGMVTAVSCVVCWIKKKFKKHDNCLCDCHEEKHD